MRSETPASGWSTGLSKRNDSALLASAGRGMHFEPSPHAGSPLSVLLQKLDLSYLFPFQGLSVIIIAFSSVVFLKERLSGTLIVGVVLITAGVILVSAS